MHGSHSCEPLPEKDMMPTASSDRAVAAWCAPASATGRSQPQAIPARIVSTSPSITETLFALGLGDRVVGVSTYCRYPPAVAALPKVGTFLKPDAETIARLKPDLVFVHKGPNNGRRAARHARAQDRRRRSRIAAERVCDDSGDQRGRERAERGDRLVASSMPGSIASRPRSPAERHERS